MAKRKAGIVDSNPRPQKAKCLGNSSPFEQSLVNLLGGKNITPSAFTFVKKVPLEQFCDKQGIQIKRTGKYGKAVKNDFIDGIFNRYVHHIRS
jgi:hypothetical protein